MAAAAAVGMGVDGKKQMVQGGWEEREEEEA